MNGEFEPIRCSNKNINRQLTPRATNREQKTINERGLMTVAEPDPELSEVGDGYFFVCLAGFSSVSFLVFFLPKIRGLSLRSATECYFKFQFKDSCAV